MDEKLIQKIYEGKIAYFIRKSRWILLFMIIKITLLITLMLLGFRFMHIIIKSVGKDLLPLIIFVAYLSTVTIYVYTIVSIVKYFYDLLIITGKSIYKFKLGLLFLEDISVIDLYRIQEIKAYSKGMINVLLNIGEVHLVEQKESAKIIHSIYNPHRIAKLIKGVQHKLIEERRK